MLCNRQIKECIICYDSSSFIKSICFNCDCYICNKCAKKYIRTFKNKKCPKCRLNLRQEIILIYKKRSYKNYYLCYLKIYFSCFLVLSICYFIGYGITKSHKNENIALNFIIGFTIICLASCFLNVICVKVTEE